MNYYYSRETALVCCLLVLFSFVKGLKQNHRLHFKGIVSRKFDMLLLVSCIDKNFLRLFYLIHFQKYNVFIHIKFLLNDGRRHFFIKS
jgi:hypothetical protein